MYYAEKAIKLNRKINIVEVDTNDYYIDKVTRENSENSKTSPINWSQQTVKSTNCTQSG